MIYYGYIHTRTSLDVFLSKQNQNHQLTARVMSKHIFLSIAAWHLGGLFALLKGIISQCLALNLISTTLWPWCTSVVSCSTGCLEWSHCDPLMWGAGACHKNLMHRHRRHKNLVHHWGRHKNLVHWHLSRRHKNLLHSTWRHKNHVHHSWLQWQ